MLKIHNPADAPKPVSNYSQGIEAPANARWLHVSGQVGVAPDGRVGAGFAEQAELACRNLVAVLRSADMGPENIVKVTTFLTDPANIVELRGIRDRVFGGAAPASTLVVVAGLARPDWLVEIEAVAAQP